MDNKRQLYDLSITVFNEVWQTLSRTMGPLSTTIIFNRALQTSQSKILRIDKNNLNFQDFTPEIDIGSYYSSFLKLKKAIMESLEKLTGNLLTEKMEKEFENALAAMDKFYNESLK